MNHQEASWLASLIENRWPARIQATIDEPVARTDEQGYSVRVVIPREYRVLRLGRTAQLPGVLDVCATLLGPKTVSFEASHKTEEGRNTMSLDQLQQETDTFSEEEAATYLGVKVVSIRAYANSETLHRQENGGFLLEELRRYKDARDARGRSKPTPADHAPTLPEALSTPGVIVVEEAATLPTIGVPVPVLAPAPDDAHIPSEEERTLQAVIAHAFASIPGIRGLGRLSEIPRSWKVDLMTERGPESYRITRDVDGRLQQERW